MTKRKRLDIRSILKDPARRRELFVGVIVAIQQREGIDTTREQAIAAYDKAQRGGLAKAGWPTP